MHAQWVRLTWGTCFIPSASDQDTSCMAHEVSASASGWFRPCTCTTIWPAFSSCSDLAASLAGSITLATLSTSLTMKASAPNRALSLRPWLALDVTTICVTGGRSRAIRAAV